MNWFVSGVTRRLMTEDDGFCDHLKVGEVATRYTAECDSWGREVNYMCEDCWEQHQEAIRNEEVTCCDCGGQLHRKDTVEWKPYDFDASQGDVSLTICNNCVSLPQHLNRVEHDECAYRREFPEDAEY